MVLRLALVLILFSGSLWAADPQAYDKASALAQKNRKEAALRVLEANYNLRNRELPLKVAHLAVSLLVSLKSWHKAEQVADSALRTYWPGWPAVDVKKKNSNKADLLPLVKYSAQAKTEILSMGDESESHTRLKNEIKTYTDIMAGTGSAEEAQALTSRTEEIPAAKQDDYKLGFYLMLSYWTWEDRPSFDYNVSGKAQFFTPCFGLGANYTNEVFEWSGSACAGAGTGAMVFNDGHYDNHAKVTLLSGSGSGLVRISDRGSAFGLEGTVMNITSSGTITDGTRKTATNEEFAILGVGRYRVKSFEMKFKGGPMISSPSALWVAELSYLF